MIDAQTGQTVMVLAHEKFGPYIAVSAIKDTAELSEFLAYTHYLPNWSDFVDGQVPKIYCYFGPITDPIKLQEILDRINVAM